MIFREQIERAEDRSQRLAILIDEVKSDLEATTDLVDQCSDYLTAFSEYLARAQETGEPFLVDNGEECDDSEMVVYPYDGRLIRKIREQWEKTLRELREAKVRLEQRLQELDDRKAAIDFWILEQRQTWGKVPADILRDQVRQILRSATELSEYLVKRRVPVGFDIDEKAPLGQVPVVRRKKEGRKITLNARILAEQPKHWFDYYRALIVHELGHVLLHSDENMKDYRRLRSLLGKRMTAAPGFFQLFNILLDEQLERVLRDTKPEWQRWFNRLEFYANRLPLEDLYKLVSAAGDASPETTVKEWANRRLVKVYQDSRAPFVRLQSAEVLSLGIGFSRPYALLAVFAYQLPLATVKEPWLRECLECIPASFKDLTVFEMHQLAVDMYRIMMPTPDANFVTAKVHVDDDSEPFDVVFPASGETNATSAETSFAVRLGDQEDTGRTPKDNNPSQIRSDDPSQTNPEGEPPPDPPPPKRQRPQYRPRRSSGGGGSSSRRRRKQTRGGGVILGKGYFKTWTSSRKTQRVPLSAQERLKRGMKARNLSAREKIRLQGEAKREREQQRQQRHTKPQSPQGLSSGPNSQLPSPPKNLLSQLTDAQDTARQQLPRWSPADGTRELNHGLKQLVNEVREEMRREQIQAVEIDRVTPESTQGSDFRNESDTTTYPQAEGVFRLNCDPQRRIQLEQAARPWVSLLRPYLRFEDEEREMEERLYRGKRLLASGLKKRLAYGEVRLFKDMRLMDMENHQSVCFAVLIDTSASMGTDGRLQRAKILATVLSLCLADCTEVRSIFVGYNQNLYLCGDHTRCAVGNLEPAGKTNEAAALAYLRDEFLSKQADRKIVLVLTDGLPTACSVESVKCMVRGIEKDRSTRLACLRLSEQTHPAYAESIDFSRSVDGSSLSDLGRLLKRQLR